MLVELLAKRCGDDAQRSLLVPEVDDSVDEFWLGECDLGEQSDRVVVVGDLMADGIGERVDGDCQPVSPRSFAARAGADSAYSTTWRARSEAS